MKTNEKGQYKFYTLKPVAYPGARIPAHIHATVKEDGINEYYIDDFQFQGDPFLTVEERNKQQNRGGDGIVSLRMTNGVFTAERNIILGKNVPHYPSK